MRKVTVLQVLRGSGSFGGVASFLLSRYSLMDKNIIEFSFLFCQEDCLRNSIYIDIVGKNNIFELNALKQENGLKEYKELYYKLVFFLSNHKFDFIHINTGSLPVIYVCLKAANKVGVSNIIAHSHSSNYMNGQLNTNLLLRPIKKYLQWSIYKNSQYHFACSEMAAKNMFGNRQYTFICNSIDVKKFDYDRNKRIEIRTNFDISNEKVYGYVGRLSSSKNLVFLLKIFENIKIIEPEAKLWIVGEGEERDNIEKMIMRKALSDSVVMFGNINDVNELMQAMDIIIFPSLYEGLSLTVIEAQAAGLPVYMSDTLSKEHKITDLVHFISLNEDSNTWAERILNDNNLRTSKINDIIKCGYDLIDSVKWFEDFYEKQRHTK